MISESLQKQMDAAYAQAAKVKSAEWSVNGKPFTAVRGAHNRGRDDDEFIDGLSAEVSDSSHLFWISAFRSTFPATLLDNNKVNFAQGAYATCDTDGRDYIVEHIPDDVDTPWLRFQLREI